MTTELAKKETQPVDMKAQIAFGKKALNEIRVLVKMRPDRVVINGKQYLEFCDWQILGSFFGITAFVEWTREITEEIPSKEVPGFSFIKTIGFLARAQALKDGRVISAAESECILDEPNWRNKPRFQARSMAETRACAKVLRQVLQWVVKLPDEGKQEFADESREEIYHD